MTYQEYTALGLAAVCLVTNFLGAAFTIRRVYKHHHHPVSTGSKPQSWFTEHFSLHSVAPSGKKSEREY
ncbi:MAG TPA: hypothetical protein VFQ87_02275 [Bradyrhizobium sp.]|jgi:hypothetical protein|nr:hypothetical protein [Bradyrhizobium sp.]